jgi:hypothetical protein
MGENKLKSKGEMVGGMARSGGINEADAIRVKCGGRVLSGLDQQVQRLEMMVSSLEETLGPVLLYDPVCGSSKGSEPEADLLPEFLEHVRQHVCSTESSLDCIQSLRHRSEL